MQILFDNHPSLLTKCPVTTYDQALLVLDDMFKTMDTAGGIGLAANQVGIIQRFFIMDSSKNGLRRHTIINPVVINTSKDIVPFNEGCLSYPGHYIAKTRFKWIKISYINHKGIKREKKFTGLEAIIVQHEMDHLDGKKFK